MSYILAFSLLAFGQPGPSAHPEMVVVEGKIRELSGAGKTRASLLTDSGETLILQSDRPELQTELRRLSGVRVRLTAAPRAEHGPTSMFLKVRGYEILDVGGGVVPRLGRLAQLTLGSEARLLFVGEDGLAHLLPRGWASKMNQHLGAKLWVVGTEAKGELRVKRFAILSPGLRPEGETKPKTE